MFNRCIGCYKWFSSFVVCENNLFIMVKFGCMLESKSDSIVLEKWILLECNKNICKYENILLCFMFKNFLNYKFIFYKIFMRLVFKMLVMIIIKKYY